MHFDKTLEEPVPLRTCSHHAGRPLRMMRPGGCRTLPKHNEPANRVAEGCSEEIIGCKVVAGCDPSTVSACNCISRPFPSGRGLRHSKSMRPLLALPLVLEGESKTSHNLEAVSSNAAVIIGAAILVLIVVVVLVALDYQSRKELHRQ